MLEGLEVSKQEDIAFQVIVALRDALGIARKGVVTYEQAIRVLYDVNPSLYSEIINVIGIKNITELARYYQEQVLLIKHSEDRDVSAEELITAEINRLNQIMGNREVQTALTTEELKQTTKRLHQLIAARDSLSNERRITEHTILARDFNMVDRSDLGAVLFHSEDRFVDYRVNANTYLRIRLLHPDKPEHITGADMIYEQHNTEKRLIRFVFLQYKMWLSGILKIASNSREERQLNRLKNMLCDKGLCGAPQNDTTDLDYRFPYCCGFLRPTDKMQKRNNKLISSGIHIPVCNALSILKREMGTIDKRFIRHQTLTQDVFEHLFNKALLGSRWLTENIVQELYASSEIISPTESVIIYSREIYEPENTAETVENAT